MYKNKDFKVKLIFPCGFEVNEPYAYSSTYYLPYGMGILTSFLRKHNYYVEQEDFRLEVNNHKNFLRHKINLDILKCKDEIREILKTGNFKCRLGLFIDRLLDSISLEGFNLIGFSNFSFLNLLFAFLLSKRIKQKSDIPIVLGGPFISLFGHLYSYAFNFIDYMIVGDGEVSLLRLIDYLNRKISISEVPNLIYKKDGKLLTNPKENYPIEEMPMPDFSDFSPQVFNNKNLSFLRDKNPLSYQISRGCTNRCAFCANIYINCKLEFKSYEKVLTELEQMKERYNSNMFYFCDDGINNSYEYLETLCNLFIKNKLNIHWSVYSKVGNLDKHILRKMRKAGCQWLSFGIESGSDRMLKMMNKGFTSEEAGKILKEAYEAEIKSTALLIAGYPYETQEDIKHTAEFMRKNRKYIHYAQVYIFHLYYSSPIFFHPERYGITNLTPTRLRYVFTFDESGGLKWEQKQKQQEDSERQIIKAVHKYIRFKNLIFYLIRLSGFIILKLKEYVT